jgi:hypothetical protein
MPSCRGSRCNQLRYGRARKSREDDVMKILVTGAGGMIGRKLVERLVADKVLGGKPIESLTLVDVVESPIPPGAPKNTKPITADFSEKGVAATLIQERPDVIFHLAAIVSGDAEANFEKGYRINFNGSWALFEAIRQEGKDAQALQAALCLCFDLAVFGPPFPDPIPRFAPPPDLQLRHAEGDDRTAAGRLQPQGLSGRRRRAPAHHLHPPGKPNKAASSFFSGILREPLAGQEAPLPVGDEVRHWFASPAPRSAFSSPPPPSTLVAGRAPFHDHAGRLRHGGRTDRGLAQGRRRQGRCPDQARR